MICRLPKSVHDALMADTARAMARRTPAVAQAAQEARAMDAARLLDILPAPTTAFDLFVPDQPDARQFVGVDHRNGKDLSCEIRGHMESPVLVVDQVRHYCPEHKYTPPENSGMSFCPFCEIEAMEQVDGEGATP